MIYIKLALTVTLSIFMINTNYVYSKSLLPKGIKRSETVIWGTRHSKKIADNKNFNICKKTYMPSSGGPLYSAALWYFDVENPKQDIMPEIVMTLKMVLKPLWTNGR